MFALVIWKADICFEPSAYAWPFFHADDGRVDALLE